MAKVCKDCSNEVFKSFIDTVAAEIMCVLQIVSNEPSRLRTIIQITPCSFQVYG